ncbi:hypothetical protein Clacol_000009 [Clathrus columnatus]|uniref:tripeptidyl-peptidase II n=1 Tax=Clathrus columnatus TaxID=1419009 RepID=A0AAV4ZW70_9AGAM|nr:hypothetical protein Clacol_000009 [Clathrus columnatus]
MLKVVLFKLTLALFGAVVTVTASPTPYNYVLKETFEPSKEWVKHKQAPPDHEITLRISLAQPRLSELEQHLYAVSNPESARYGQHLSKEQVQELSAPSADALEALNSWLYSHGFDVHSADELDRSPSLDWVKVKTTVQQAEEMLNTTYHVWKHTSAGEFLVRTTSWSVPDFLSEHIDLVHPTTMFSSRFRAQAATFRLSEKEPGLSVVASIPSSEPLAVDPSCNNTITPTCVLELYNATQYKVQAPDKSKIAISSYLGEFANIADLEQFYSLLRPEAINTSFTLISINGKDAEIFHDYRFTLLQIGGQNNQTLSEAGAEADLDTQYAFGVAFPIPAVVFTTAGSPPFIPDFGTPTDSNEPYLNWLDFVLAQDNIPQTISSSYGDDEQTVPVSFAKKVCSGFARLGARGISVMVSSGDGGVGDNDPNPATQTCFTNNGKNETRFIPGFPASCPFVTAVGGTVNVPEVAVKSFGSGGGFSNIFSRPKFQNSAVLPFLKSIGNTNKGFFNPNGRAIPDVAAQGDNVEIVFRGRRSLIGGTSAASPIFAGIVALLNDARIAAGKPSLGFLNPLIYGKASKAFNDITIGSNPGCGTEGFSCAIGWDAVTGFGTPNFGLLQEIVLRDG